LEIEVFGIVFPTEARQSIPMALNLTSPPFVPLSTSYGSWGKWRGVHPEGIHPEGDTERGL